MSLSSLPELHGEDLMNLMCNTLLGSGQYRHVYSGKQDATLVFKYEREVGRNCNQTEWEMWMEMKNHELGKWLAPCIAISPDARWLIQHRTEPLQYAQLPDKIPRIFCDTKIENWGMLDGRVVCHDYGNNNGAVRSCTRVWQETCTC
jgi:hypothetical protein